MIQELVDKGVVSRHQTRMAFIAKLTPRELEVYIKRSLKADGYDTTQHNGIYVCGYTRDREAELRRLNRETSEDIINRVKQRNAAERHTKAHNYD